MDDVGTAKLVGWVLMAVALCIVVGVTSIAYIETLYMKAANKRAEKRIEKKLTEVENVLQELKDLKDSK